MNLLDPFKTEEFHGVRELAEAAKRALITSGTSQEKGTVSEFPNERTIRYYITEGLLDQAIKKRGVTSVFGYEHLLTLLTIKKLQSDGLPIGVIKTLIEGRSVEELEELFGEEVHVFNSQQELDAYRSSAGHTDDSEVQTFASMPMAAAPPPEPPKANSAKRFLESLLLDSRKEKKESPAPSTLPAQPPPSLTRGTSDWRRYDIVPGVELHISRSFKPPKDATFRQRILVLIDGILHSRER